MHDTVAIHELTLMFTAAMAAGLIFIKLRQPALIGFILMGALIGPTGLGLIESTENLRILAELGVTMLMFVIGMELSLRSFRRIYRSSVAIALAQLAASLAISGLIGMVFDWGTPRIIALGFALALSSTAVGLKVLEGTDELRSHAGQVAVGVLIAQDLLTAPMLITINGLATGGNPIVTIGIKLLLAVTILIAIVIFLSRREKLKIPFSDWMTDHSGTVALGALTFCFCLGTLSELLGLAVPFGAFLAGLILGNSIDRQRFLTAVMPIQEILIMLFFLSIGLLIDIGFVVQNIVLILLLTFIVVVIKTLITYFMCRLVGVPQGDAAVSSSALGSMGEFSFVIGAAALSSGFIVLETSKLLISVIFMSLLITPLWLGLARRFSSQWQRHQEHLDSSTES